MLKLTFVEFNSLLSTNRGHFWTGSSSQSEELLLSYNENIINHLVIRSLL